MGKEKSSILCPKCFTFNPEESDLCNKCGALLEEKQDTISYDFASLPPDIKIHFSPGDNFGKRYRIIEEIGRGGMGIVYKAEDLELNITVALKVIHPRYSADPRFIERFKREILSARSIAHENVIRIFDLGEEDNVKYISMEFIRGQNLKDLITTSGFLTKKSCIEMIRQICEALKAAHQHGIVHRDLKPSNIMIDINGQAHVMDFGLAKSMSGLESEKTKAIQGTPKYMSPEQAKGEDLDQRADIYSLGLIIFEMLTGKPPFEATAENEYLIKHIQEKPLLPSKLNPEVPSNLDRIVAKCLEKNKDDRYPSIDDILRDVTSSEAELQPIPQRSRLKTFLPFIAMAAALIIVMMGIFIFRNGKKELLVPPSEEMRTSIAVMYFENNTGDDSLDYLRRALANLIIYDLLQSKYIRPLTSDRLIEIHGQLHLEDTGHYSTENLKEVASRGNAENILWGSFHKRGDKIRINTLIYEASTWKLIGSPSVEAQNETTLVDDLTREIKTSFKLSETLIAEDIDRKVGEITTESPQALNYYFQGLKSYDEGKFELSNEDLLKAVELDPGFAMAYRKISVNFAYLGDSVNSKIYLEKAISNLGRVSDRERYLIQGYHAQVVNNSLEEAIKYYQELLSIYPDDVYGNIQLGSVYRNLEEWDEASIRFERVLLVDKNNIIGCLNKAHILKAKGFYDRAREFLETNQHVFSNQAVFHMLMSRLFLNQGKVELALQEAEKLRTIEPENIDYNLIKGQIHHVKDESSSAGKEYEILIKQDDEDRQLWGRLWMSRLHLTEGMLEKAKKEASEGLMLARKHRLQAFEVDFFLMLAYLNLRLKAFDEALEATNLAIEMASEINARDEERYGCIYKGLIYLASNNLSMAEETATQLKHLIENSGYKNFMRNYYYLMGMIYQKKGNISQATDYFEMAFNSLPHQKSTPDNHALYLDALATAERMKGDMNKAREYSERMIALTTGKLKWGDLYVLSHYQLGKIYQEKGLKEDAITQFEKFLKLWENADYAHTERADAGKQLVLLKPSVGN